MSLRAITGLLLDQKECLLPGIRTAYFVVRVYDTLTQYATRNTQCITLFQRNSGGNRD